jgi:alpha-L-fucosidase 2
MKKSYQTLLVAMALLPMTLTFIGCQCPAPPAEAYGSGKTYELWEPEPAPNRGHDFDNPTRGRGYPHDPDWESWSYPLGNGNLGANVFGRTDIERIQLTEKTIANGSAYGRGGVTNAGELYLDIGHEEISDYRRALCLNDAIKTVSYRSGGIGYQREYFTSYPNDILVIRLTADRPGALTFSVRPEIPYLEAKNPLDSKSGTVTAEGDTVTMAGTVDYYQVNFEIQVKVINEGGTVTARDAKIEIENADSVTLLVAADTNYELGPHIFLNEPKEKLDPDFNPHELVVEKMTQAVDLGYEQLKARHLEDYRNLFGRVSLNLNSEVSELPTHQLVEAYRQGEYDPYLEELIFQFGRYLLIASSRETTLPAHLQGAWSQYEVSPWCSGYWHNINVQMNYWGAFSANLAETFEAYLNYFHAYKPLAHRYAAEYVAEQQGPDAVSENPAENGWIVGTGANAYQISGRSNHSGPGTGAFTAQLLMDYYDFTQDEDFLRETGYPALLQMSKFFAKALKEREGGLLLISPSASPEIKHEGKHYITEGCTFDQGFVWENHQNVLRAAAALGEDDPFLEVIQSQVPRLDPILIGSSGQIKEFREEDAYGDIGDPEHRHVSHLHTLYPGTLINTSHPEWMEAAAVTLNKRGDISTGWAMAHRMICWARLRNSERALELYHKFITHKTTHNLWSLHPPFQIDGNFGVMAAVSEMLLQSHEGCIEPLPALPEAWGTGRFDGLVARGNFEVSAVWEAGGLRELSIHSRSGKACRVKYPGLAAATVVAEDGQTIESTANGSDEIAFPTREGMTYQIQLKSE